MSRYHRSVTPLHKTRRAENSHFAQFLSVKRPKETVIGIRVRRVFKREESYESYMKCFRVQGKRSFVVGGVLVFLPVSACLFSHNPP